MPRKKTETQAIKRSHRATTGSSKNVLSKVACPNYSLGLCSLGKSCPLSHDPMDLRVAVAAAILRQSPFFRTDGVNLNTPALMARPIFGPILNTSPMVPHAYTPAGYPIDLPCVTQHPPCQATAQPHSEKTSAHVSWRTTPCKHWIKHKNWCPSGASCSFIHDLSLPNDYSSTPKVSRTDQEFATGKSKDRVISGGVSLSQGPKQAHCWAYIQGKCRVDNCKFFHPKDIEPYFKYTPCRNWDLCSGGDCPFRHPTQPISAALAQPSPPVAATWATESGDITSTSFVRDGVTYYPYSAYRAPRPLEPEELPETAQALAFLYKEEGKAPLLSQSTDNRKVPSEDNNSGDLPSLGLDSLQSLDSMSSANERESTGGTDPKGAFPFIASRSRRSRHARRISVNILPRVRGRDIDNDYANMPPTR